MLFQDLLSLATSDALERKLYDLYTYAKKHIFECVLCRQKGFYCEICRSNEILFPFELDRVLKVSFKELNKIYYKFLPFSAPSVDLSFIDIVKVRLPVVLNA